MPNKTAYVAALILVIVAAGIAGIVLLHPPGLIGSGGRAPNESTSTQITTVPANQGGESIQQYTKIYAGGSATFLNQYTVHLVSINKTGGQLIASLNITNSHGAFNRFIGSHQFVGLGPNSTAPYVLLNQISSNSSISSQNWVTLNMSMSSVGGFSEALNNGFSSAPGNNGNYISTANESIGNSTEEELLHMPTNFPACEASNAFFSTPPVSLFNLTNIMPLGHVNPTSHTFPINHVYFYLKLYPNNRTAIKTDALSPGNITIYKIERWNMLSPTNGTVLWTEYQLAFAPCAHVAGFFYHLSSLSDKLISNDTPPFAYCSNVTGVGTVWQDCGKYVDIRVKAGEKIGTAGGQYSQALDWGFDDFRSTPMVFANDSRFVGVAQDYSRYVVCPLDYFTPDMRNTLYGLLAGEPVNSRNDSVLVRRTTLPLCGSSDQDISGTAQGSWFAANAPIGANFVEDPNLALVPDNINTTLDIFSVGTSMSSKGLPAGAYYFSPSASGLANRSFANITADRNRYCFQTTEKSYGGNPTTPTIIMQLITPSHLRIERISAAGCGSGPWSFTSNYTDFYR